MHKTRKVIKVTVDRFRQAFSKLSSPFVDSHLIPNDCPDITNAEKFALTQRYRFASLGFALSKNEREIGKFKDKYIGRRTFIIGNGPSLNKCDLTPLKNEITFGVNSIFLNTVNMGFLPNFYVVEDVYVAEDRSSEINSLHGPVKFFGNYLKYCLHSDPKTYWLNVRFRYDDYPDFPAFSRDALRMVWVGGTVTYMCLQLAFYMGFSEVYLIGFDHSYIIPGSAQVDGNEILSTENDPNHFHPEYFGKGYRWHDPKVERMEKAFLKAKKEYEKDNRKIYNATVGGNLNVFDRIEYSSLFQNGNKI
jgi:hypothetical protein